MGTLDPLACGVLPVAVGNASRLFGYLLNKEKIYRAVGSYLGYAVGHYADFYELEHLLLLGRVSSGKGGSIIIEEAQAVLRDEFPEHHVEFHIPDEAFKRHGQAVIAGTLPELG